MVGKRQRVVTQKKSVLKLVNLSHVVMGGSLLWFGWFGFNGCAGFVANGASIPVTNTQLAAAFAFFVFIVGDWITKGQPTVVGGFSGVVIGLVAVTPCAGYIPVQTAPAVGVFTAVVCYLVLFLKQRYLKDFFPGFDDTLDVATGHGVAGVCGTFALGWLSQEAMLPGGCVDGVFYGGGFLLLGWQTVAICVTLVWAGAMTFLILLPIKLALNLRVSEKEETEGGDSVFDNEGMEVINQEPKDDLLITQSRAEVSDKGGDVSK